MNKKLLLILLIITCLFTITACKKEDIASKEEENKGEEKLLINGNDFTLTKSDTFENIRYRFPDNTVVSSLGTYTILIVNNSSNEELAKVAITKFNYKTPEEAVEGTLKDTIMFNGDEWVLFDTDGSNTYAHQDGHDTYTITFIYNDDLSRFEKEFMNSINFIE